MKKYLPFFVLAVLPVRTTRAMPVHGCPRSHTPPAAHQHRYCSTAGGRSPPSPSAQGASCTRGIERRPDLLSLPCANPPGCGGGAQAMLVAAACTSQKNKALRELRAELSNAREEATMLREETEAMRLGAQAPQGLGLRA